MSETEMVTIRVHPALLRPTRHEDLIGDLVLPPGVTSEQWTAISFLARNHAELAVYPRTFDLPEGFITFWQQSKHGNRVYGGIAPDGAIST